MASARTSDDGGADAFTFGKDIGVAAGAVVVADGRLRSHPVQAEHADRARQPLLMVPPMINKYYITDLAPLSMLGSTSSQGVPGVRVSWGLPRMERDWDLNTYGGAMVDGTVDGPGDHEVPKVNVIGLCAGGPSMVGAHLATIGSWTRSTCAGRDAARHDAGLHDDRDERGHRHVSKPASEGRKGYMDGSRRRRSSPGRGLIDLLELRVNNYLQGQAPPLFDILYWNADTTRMPACCTATSSTSACPTAGRW